MEFNLPPKLRLAIYVLSGVGDIVFAYLFTIGVFGKAEITAWTALSVFVKGLAAVNVNTSSDSEL